MRDGEPKARNLETMLLTHYLTLNTCSLCSVHLSFLICTWGQGDSVTQDRFYRSKDCDEDSCPSGIEGENWRGVKETGWAGEEAKRSYGLR